jgi:hypothetical protein
MLKELSEEELSEAWQWLLYVPAEFTNRATFAKEGV